MSPAKPISAATSPLLPATPSPFKPRYFITASLHSCAPPQKRDPFFSTACALFLIRNSVYPFRFVKTANSLPKAAGGRVGLSNQIPAALVTPTESISFTRITLNPIESYSFTRFTPKPNGILLFQNDSGGGGVPLLALF